VLLVVQLAALAGPPLGTVPGAAVAAPAAGVNAAAAAAAPVNMVTARKDFLIAFHPFAADCRWPGVRPASLLMGSLCGCDLELRLKKP
jgi:hypothetical protein